MLFISSTPSGSSLFLPPLLQGFLSPSRRDLMQTSHLQLSVPRSLTSCCLAVGLCNLFPFAAEGSFSDDGWSLHSYLLLWQAWLVGSQGMPAVAGGCFSGLCALGLLTQAVQWFLFLGSQISSVHIRILISLSPSDHFLVSRGFRMHLLLVHSPFLLPQLPWHCSFFLKPFFCLFFLLAPPS